MPQALTRFAATALLALAAAWGNAQAGDWGDVAIISGTVGNNPNRLCMGVPDHMRPADIGCPSYAPSLSTAGHVSITGNVSANKFIGDGAGLTNLSVQGDRIVSDSYAAIVNQSTGHVSLTAGGSTWGYFSAGWSYLANFFTNTVSSSLVSATNVSATYVDATRLGTVSATYGYFRYISGTDIYGRFTGDGSGLTGVVAGATDRIVSGSTGGTRMVAVSATGYISITQAGANSGWFSPYTGLVTLGVSSTGPISGTHGYFSGNVGIGTSSLQHPLMVSGTVGFYPFGAGATPSIWLQGDLAYQGVANVLRFRQSNSTAGALAFTFFNDAFTPLAIRRFGGNDARIGVGTLSPTARVDVVGTISASDAIQIGTSSLNCGAGIAGALRYSGSNIEFCNGASWGALVGAADVMGDRIVSGTTNAIAWQDRSLTITTAGTQRMIVGENGRVGIGFADPTDALDVRAASDPAMRVSGITGNNSVLASLKLVGTNTGGAASQESYLVSYQPSGGAATDAALDVRVRKSGDAFGFPSTIMTLWGSGRVGIGTNVPNGTLDVHASAGATIRISSSDANTNNMLVYRSPEATANINLGRSGLSQKANALNIEASGDINFYPGGVNQGSERMVLESGGNVGIGLISPTAKLQVSGTFTVSMTGQRTSPSLHVDAEGNVGIGSISSTAALMVKRPSGNPVNVQIQADHPNAYERVGGLTLSLFRYDPTGEGAAVDFYRGGYGSDAAIVFRTNDGVSFGASATERMRITPRGSVGIGTNAPAISLTVVGEVQVSNSGVACGSTTRGAIRYIHGTGLQYCNGSVFTTLGAGGGGAFEDRIVSGSTNIIAHEDRSLTFTTVNTQRMVVGEDGRVGIGTNVPASNLHVAMDGSPMLRISGAGSSLSNAAFLSLERYRGTNAAPGYTTPGDWLGVINFLGYTSERRIGAAIRGYADDGWGTTGADSPGALVLLTTPDGTGTLQERVRLDSAGRMGIGTGSPTATLTVSGTISATDAIQVGSSSLACSSGIPGAIKYNAGSLQYCNGTSWTSLSASGGGQEDRIVSGTTNAIAWQDSSVTISTNGVRRVTVGANGRTGFGTSSPGMTLDVSASFAGDGVRVFGTTPAFTLSNAAGTSTSTFGQAGNNGQFSSIATPGDGVLRAMGGDLILSALSPLHNIYFTTGSPTDSIKMAILQDGSVGVGTATPTAALQVSGTFSVSSSSYVNSPTFYVDALGRTGIGVMPSSSVLIGGGLHIQNNGPSGHAYSTVTGLLVENNGISPGFLVFQTMTAGGGKALNVTNAGNVGISNTMPRAKLDVMGTISASDAIQVGTSSLTCGAGIPGAIRYNGGSLQYCNGSNWTTLGTSTGVTGTGSATAVAFWSGPSALTYSDGFYWDYANKRLGIGTNNPSVTLNLVSNHLGAGTIRTMNLHSQGYAGITMMSHTNEIVGALTYGNSNAYLFPNAVWIGARSNTVPLVFTANGSDVEDMRLSNGRLGIGTSSATATLQVSGTFVVSTSNQETSPTLFVSGNRVGVMTSKPWEMAHVGNEGVGGRLWIGEDNSTRRGLLIAATVANEVSGSAYPPFVRMTAFNYGTGLSIPLVINPHGTQGFVSIGKHDPKAMLDVQGTISASNAIQVGQSSLLCSSPISGSIRYNTTSDTLQVCTGGGWKSLVSGTTGGGGSLAGTGSATAVAFWNGASTLSYDSGLYWDNINKRLGVGTVAPLRGLEVKQANDDVLSGFGVANAAANSRVGLWVKGSTGHLWSGGSGQTPLVLNAGGGLVGIGTESPTAALTVSGTISATDAIQVGQSTLACSNPISGSIRYSIASSTIQVCNGTSWVGMGSGGSVGALATLTDVSASSPLANQILRYNADETKWEAVSASDAVFSCPSGYALVSAAGRAYGCIKTTENAAASCATHINTCMAEGARLPTLSEFKMAQTQYGYTVTNYVYLENAAGDSVCAGITSAGRPHGIGDTGSYPARCFIPAVGIISSTGSTALGDRITSGTTSAIAYENASLTISTGGVERMIVGQNGAVGIGTATPTTGRMLDIVKGASSGVIQIRGAGGPDYSNLIFGISPNNYTFLQSTENGNGVVLPLTFWAGTNRAISISPTGYVGISRTNPLANLDVAGTISASDAIQVGSSSATCGASIPGAIRYNGGSLQYCNTSAWTNLVSGTGGGVGGSGSANHIAYWSGADTLTYDASQLYWDATNNRLGIGNANLGASLDVSASGFGEQDLAVFSGGNSGNVGSGARLYLSGGNGVSRAAYLAGVNTGGGANGHALVLGTSSNASLPVERMRIDKDGKVGIGTTSPWSALDVSSSSKQLRLSTGTNAYASFSAYDGGGAGIDPILDMDLQGGDADKQHYIRMFRNTNTSGSVALIILRGDNTASTNSFLSGNGNSFLNALVGNVGIGLTNPAAKLAVTADLDQEIIARFDGTSPTSQRRIAVNNQGGGDAQASFMNGGTTRWSLGNEGSSNNFVIRTGAGVFGTSADVLTIVSGTKAVGIGTTTPSTTLYVNGGQIAGGFGAMSTSGVLDFNDVSNARSGNGYTLLRGSTAANAPNTSTNYWQTLNFEYGVSKLGDGNVTQLAIPYSSSASIAESMFMRGRYSGTWTGWYKFIMSDPSGSAVVANNMTAAAFLYSSDKRLKENVVPLSGGLAKLDAINPVTFRFISDTTHTERLGVIAQEIEKVYPQAVVTGPDGYKKVDYPSLVPVLIQAVKELKAANDNERAEREKLQQIVDNYRMLQRSQVTEHGLMLEQFLELKAVNDNLMRRIDALEGRKAAVR